MHKELTVGNNVRKKEAKLVHDYSIKDIIKQYEWLY